MTRRRDSLGWLGVVTAIALAWGCDKDANPGDSADADPNAADSAVTDGPVANPDAPLGAADAGNADAGDTSMNFFVSSESVNGSGDLGGLAGADTLCQTLAAAASASRTVWVAYLSVDSGAVGGAVNAIDRITAGPWYNANGDILAPDKVTLHPTIDPAVDRDGYIAVKPADALFVDETGGAIPERQHDIFTGSNADGTVSTGGTCNNWTSASVNDFAIVGHTDTPVQVQFSPSWNSAHETLNCSVSGVTTRGGSGRIYCFATD